MKKLFFVAGITAALSGLTAFGQGNFNFSTGGRFVWNTGPANAVPGGPWNVAFLWSANLSATTLVSQVTGLSHTLTNELSLFQMYDFGAFNAILSDPNFQLGRDTSTGLVAVGTLTGAGGISYNLGNPFGVAGTSTAGGSVMAFFIAWNNAYATPQAAAVSFPVAGWSNPFLYNYANASSSPIAMGSQSVTDGVDAHFGFGIRPGIPEPSAFALAGLGAAAMLILRRRTPARHQTNHYKGSAVKKLFFVAGMTAALSGLTAFGQGNFNFSTGGRFVWNTAYVPAIPGGPWNVAFLWSTNLGATPLVAQVTGLSHTPTNYSIFGFGLEGSAILSDPNFQLGRDASTGLVAVGTLTATGGITYNGSSPFGVAGTSTAGGNVMAFFIAWRSWYASPAQAAAAGSVWGWSNQFLYSYANVSSSPASMGLQSVSDGVDAHFGLGIPEPSAFALAGLGAVVMLILRRRTPARHQTNHYKGSDMKKKGSGLNK